MSDLVKTEQASVPSTTNANVPSEDFSPSDMIIPRLLLQQGQSKFVAARKASIGDIVRSTNAEKLTDDRGAPIAFVPLTFRKSWVLEEKVGQKFEFRGYEPRPVESDTLPWTFTKDGVEWRRLKNVDVVALLLSDIEADEAMMKEGGIPDLNKVLLPVVISFRSKSYPAGKVVMDHFLRVKGKQDRLPFLRPYMYTMDLTCAADENDKGSFFIYEVPVCSKQLKKEFLPIAEYWHGIVTNQTLKVDAEESQAPSSEDAGDTSFDGGIDF